MRLEPGFERDAPYQVLMALNWAPTLIPVFAEQIRIPAPPPLNFSLRPKNAELHKATQEAFVKELRSLVDAWIETGRDPSGFGEEPRGRKLLGNLRQTVNGWWARNRPDVLAGESGEPEILMPVHKINFTGNGLLINPLDAVREEAIRWFAWFLNFPHRYRLCKCRLCEEYYLTQREPRGRIEYGTYCARHRHQASATRSYEAKHGPAVARRLDVAAKYWGKWPKAVGGDAGKRAQWVATKVNIELPKWTPIRRNWVTLHHREIELRSTALHEKRSGLARPKTKGGANAKG